jgi:hypothetical protein
MFKKLKMLSFSTHKSKLYIVAVPMYCSSNFLSYFYDELIKNQDKLTSNENTPPYGSK